MTKEYTDAFGHKHYYDDGKETKDMENELTGYCQVVGCMEHVPSNTDNPYCSEHTNKTPMLTVWDYECAINSQGACNATGLINSLNDLREKIWANARQLNKGTEWVNCHPILQLYAYQLAHLCHGREPIEWEGYHKAYLFCKLVKYGKLTPDHDYTLNDWDENTLGFPQYLK